MKIFVTLPDGQRREVPGQPGQSLMQFMSAGGIPVSAACGGALACATCHVQISDPWFSKVGSPGDEESDLLDMSDYRGDTSRLSCQVPVSADLDGLEVTLQLDAVD